VESQREQDGDINVGLADMTHPRPKPRPPFLSYHHHPKHFIQVQYGPAKCNVLELNIHAFLFSQLFIFILYGKAYIFII